MLIHWITTTKSTRLYFIVNVFFSKMYAWVSDSHNIFGAYVLCLKIHFFLSVKYIQDIIIYLVVWEKSLVVVVFKNWPVYIWILFIWLSYLFQCVCCLWYKSSPAFSHEFLVFMRQCLSDAFTEQVILFSKRVVYATGLLWHIGSVLNVQIITVLILLTSICRSLSLY